VFSSDPVDWTFTPVERLQDFKPRFCPRRDCPEHRRTAPGYRYRYRGWFQAKSGRRKQRYLCLTCHRSFSTASFSPDYYLKRPELLWKVAAGLQAGSGHRQIARTLGCAPSTVTRLAARIGRHCLLLHEHALAALGLAPAEPIVLDHFETFEFTQDLPFGVATPVGAESWFVYGVDAAPHRRTGRRSPAQRRRLRARPQRTTRGGYVGSAMRTIRGLLSVNGGSRPLQLVADDHPAYRKALAALGGPPGVRLETHRNPKRGPKGSPRSAAAVARDRAMFPADQLHALIRHSLAAHRRETIAFGRRLNALMLRLYVFLAWRNFVKGRSERKPDPVTPAMRLGPWSWNAVLARRLFPAREGLSGVNRELYRCEWTTPLLPSNRRHDLKLAY